MKDIMKVIDMYRVALGITQREMFRRVAEETGLSIPTINNMMLGKFPRSHPKSRDSVALWYDRNRAEMARVIAEATQVEAGMISSMRAAAEFAT